MLPSMFSKFAPVDRVVAFAENVAEFDPAGFRLMAKASAEDDLRDVLAGIDIPTLLLYGGQDVRAPREVAEAIWAAIPRSRLIILPGVGHISSVEALDRFCAEVRAFLIER
jgi:pimeloyl-ACP methyl ester carboxylesterase